MVDTSQQFLTYIVDGEPLRQLHELVDVQNKYQVNNEAKAKRSLDRVIWMRDGSEVAIYYMPVDSHPRGKSDKLCNIIWAADYRKILWLRQESIRQKKQYALSGVYSTDFLVKGPLRAKMVNLAKNIDNERKQCYTRLVPLTINFPRQIKITIIKKIKKTSLCVVPINQPEVRPPRKTNLRQQDMQLGQVQHLGQHHCDYFPFTEVTNMGRLVNNHQDLYLDGHLETVVGTSKDQLYHLYYVLRGVMAYSLDAYNNLQIFLISLQKLNARKQHQESYKG